VLVPNERLQLRGVLQLGRERHWIIRSNQDGYACPEDWIDRLRAQEPTWSHYSEADGERHVGHRVGKRNCTCFALCARH
jgi:hypothetical protein